MERQQQQQYFKFYINYNDVMNVVAEVAKREEREKTLAVECVCAENMMSFLCRVVTHYSRYGEQRMHADGHASQAGFYARESREK